jgi:hypothetical protein
MSRFRLLTGFDVADGWPVEGVEFFSMDLGGILMVTEAEGDK